jgi:hypothetical protein
MFFMKAFQLLVSFAILFASCSTSKRTTTSNTGNTQTTTAETTSTSSGTSKQDGSSYENAIVINEKTERPGVDAEYIWLTKNHPGYKLITQSLSNKGTKHYDLMQIKTAEGEEKTIYFDISKFFGKW